MNSNELILFIASSLIIFFLLIKLGDFLAKFISQVFNEKIQYSERYFKWKNKI